MKRALSIAAALFFACAPSAGAVTLPQARQDAAQFTHHRIAGCRRFNRWADCWYFTLNPPPGSDPAYTGDTWIVDVYVGRRGLECSTVAGPWEPCR